MMLNAGADGGRLEIFTFLQKACSGSSIGLSKKLGLVHFKTDLLDKKW